MKYDEEKGESEENEMKDSCWLRCREEGGVGRSAGRPQGLLGRGQPISLSLINSSRGDCNTAGDCWEKRRKEAEGDEIGMNGAGEEGGRNSEDEEKIGKARKTGGRGGCARGKEGGQTIGKDGTEKTGEG